LFGGDSPSAFAEALRVYVDPSIDKERGHYYEQMIINVSLGLVVASIAVSVILSLLYPPHDKSAEVAGDAPPAGS
jgi:hypothetical protein